MNRGDNEERQETRTTDILYGWAERPHTNHTRMGDHGTPCAGRGEWGGLAFGKVAGSLSYIQKQTQYGIGDRATGISEQSACTGSDRYLL